MATSKNQRILLVVNSLSKYSTGAWNLIYSFAEKSAVNLAQYVLVDQYKSIVIKKGANATKANFLAALQAAATTPGVRAVDVFFQLHGGINQVAFYDKLVNTAVLRDDILALNLPDRLRLLYDTSCYGDSHNWHHMIDAGFAAAIGSQAINCTGAPEFGTFCSMWQRGEKIKDVMAAADNAVTRAIQDAAAKAFSPTLSDANSKKFIRGDKNLTISS